MLRNYQKKIINDLVLALQKHNKVICQAPTGAGKGEIIKHICENTQKQILVLTHRKELKEDLKNRSQCINVQMIETVKRRQIDISQYDLVIIDECHISNFDDIVLQAKKIIGFTATPIRKGNQKSLHELYDIIVQSLTAQELIELGYLVPTLNYSYNFDTSSLLKSKGDFDIQDQTRQFETKKVYKGVIENYLKYANNTKTIAFTSSIESARQLTEQLQKAGLNTVNVDSTMSKEERKTTIDNFKKSSNQILVNCSLLTTGFDCSDIQTVILYRATTSESLYNQMIGRGVRIHKDKTTCTVLDFGENIKRFGFWEDPQNFELRKAKKQTNAKAPTRTCHNCGIECKIKDIKCLACDFTFQVAKRTEAPEIKLELIKNTPKSFKIGFYLHKAKNIEEAEQIVTKFGYKKGWLHYNKHRYPNLIAS
jgi:superfamily II DNA or RNA helicase